MKKKKLVLGLLMAFGISILFSACASGNNTFRAKKPGQKCGGIWKGPNLGSVEQPNNKTYWVFKMEDSKL